MAPECLSGEHTYDFSVDVFSFAVTLHQIFTDTMEFNDGGRPTKSPQQIMMRVIRGARLVKKPEIPAYHWEVIERCWKQDPKERPTFQTLLKELHDRREYILPGADRSAVAEYENRVGSEIGGPNTLSVSESDF
jgi:hypothetical protein